MVVLWWIVACLISECCVGLDHSCHIRTFQCELNIPVFFLTYLCLFHELCCVCQIVPNYKCTVLSYARSFAMFYCFPTAQKKPVTTMLTYPWKCTVLHCNHLGNTWKPLVLMTRHFDYCLSASARVIIKVLGHQHQWFPGVSQVVTM